ncbi:MAG: hypothetical protein ACFFEF_10630 [Candidatus Thorarchaeota archaeon]
MPIRFIARLSKKDPKHLGFYVPKYVMDFYGLQPGDYKGGISLKHGEVNSCSIKLQKSFRTLRGRLPPNFGKRDSIAEIWIYRDTWTPPKTKAPA